LSTATTLLSSASSTLAATSTARSAPFTISHAATP
jgi:hypothetical protein